MRRFLFLPLLFLLLAALPSTPARAVNGFDFQVVLAVSHILTAVEETPDPSPSQQIAQKAIESFSSRLFRTGTTREECIKDMRKFLRKVGKRFENSELDGTPVPELRRELLEQVIDAAKAERIFVTTQIDFAQERPTDGQAKKIEKSLGKSGAILDTVESRFEGKDEASNGATRKALAEIAQALKQHQKAAKKARKFGMDVAFGLPE